MKMSSGPLSRGVASGGGDGGVAPQPLVISLVNLDSMTLGGKLLHEKVKRVPKILFLSSAHPIN